MPKATRIALVLLVLLVIATGIYWLAAAPGSGSTKPSVAPAGPAPSGAAPKSGSPSDASRSPGVGGNAGAPKAGTRDESTAKSAGDQRRPAATPPGSLGAGATPTGGTPVGLAERSTTFTPATPNAPPGFSVVPAVGPAPSLERPIPGFVAAAPARSTPFDRPDDEPAGSPGSGVSVPPPSVGATTPPAAPTRTPVATPPAKPALPATVPASAAGAPGPTARVTEYVVRDGDTMLSIAEYWFGDRGKWDLIRAANAEVDPTRLRIGQTLRLPAKDAQRPTPKPASAGVEATHVVVSGDSLYALARAVYGDGERWTLIYDANKQAIGDDPKDLKVGMKLRIPPR